MFNRSLAAALALVGGTFATMSFASNPHAQLEQAHLVPLDPISVPIIDGDQVRGNLNIRIVLNAGNDAGEGELVHALPQVRSTLVGATSEYARLYASPYKPVDSSRLASDLKAAIKAHHPEIGEVLLVEVSARR
jgi:hypothetical protein